MAETDGQVEIGVKINTDKVDPQMQKLQQKLAKQNEALARQSLIVEKLGTQYDNLYKKAKETATPNIESDKILTQINELKKEYEKFKNELNQAKLEPEIDQAKIDEISKNLDTVRNKMSELTDKYYEVQFSPEMQSKLYYLGKELDIAVQKEGRLTNEIKATEKEIDNLSNKKLDDVKNNVDNVKNSVGNTTKNFKQLNDTMQGTQKLLQESLDKIIKNFDSLNAKISETQNKTLNYAKNTAENTFSNLGDKISGLGKKILNLGASAYVFNVISSGFHKMADGIRNAIAHDNQLSNSLAQVKANLSTAFYPIYQAILPAIQALGRALSWVTGQIASFMAMLTGTSVKANQQGAKEMMSEATALNKQAKGYDKVAKSAKKAKGQLSSFDKIEVLKIDKNDKTPTSSGGGGINGLKGFNQELKKMNFAPLDNVIKRFKELGDIFKKGFDIGFVDKNFNEIIDSANRCGTVLKNIFTDSEIVQGFNATLDTIVFNLGKVVGSVASVGVTIGRLLVGGIAGFLEQSQETIKENLLRAFDITQEMSSFIGNFSTAFANIFEIFASPQAQNSLANMLTGWHALFSSFAINVWDISVSITEALLSPFINFQEKIKEALSGTLKAVEKFSGGIRDVCVTLGKSMSDVTQKSIKPAINLVGKIWNDVFGMIINAWNTYISPMLNRIGGKFQTVVNEHIKPAIEKVATAFNNIVAKILPLIQTLWDKISPFVKLKTYLILCQML